MIETGKSYIKLFMSICTRENFSHPIQVSFFFAGTSFSLFLVTIDTSEAIFLYRFFLPTSKQN